MYMGTFAVHSQLRSWAVGDRKAATWDALSETSLAALASQPSALQRMANSVRTNLGMLPGMHAVAPDSGRRLLERTEFMQAHLDSPPLPGPVGHGFTPASVTTGRTWWKADPAPYVRLLGLDTCNTTAGADGGVPEEQFEWVKAELDAAQVEGVLCLILSHHNSLTLENDAQPVLGGRRIVHAEEFIAALLERPSCVAWINGHTHINTINAHSRPDGAGGFWEITTASAIDFPQQQQLVEIVDNRDGTISLFVTALDHASDPTWTDGDFSTVGLASLSREFAANDWIQNPPMRMGSPLDRNTELLLPSPFDLSRITDAQVEAATMVARARLITAGVDA
jgi:metallophosphoesterase (TIGR03767 family)